MNIYIESYGCAANQAEAEMIAGMLAKAGFQITENEELADVNIINTCIVKGPTLQRMKERIKTLAKKPLVVTGCMPEVLSSEIRSIAPNAALVSTNQLDKIVLAVKKLLEGKKTEFVGNSNLVKLGFPRIRKNRFIGIVPISSGCIGNCSYCVVKQVKGKLFSYPQEKIILEVKQLLKEGCKEIWLTSQDLAAYGLDRGRHELPELLKKILALPGNFFVRLGMSNPNSMLPILDELIECYKSSKVFKFLHLPVQSGSNKVLNAMNRKYKVEQFSLIVKTFRKAFPDLTLATDIIVGFPNETEKDFKQTLELIKKIKPQILNLSKFWPMPCTKASELKVLPANEVKARAKKIMELQNKLALEAKNYVGKELEVLITRKSGAFLGRALNYRLVVVSSAKNLLGKQLKVKVIKAPRYLVGKVIEN